MKWAKQKCKNYFNIYIVVFYFKRISSKTPGDVIILYLCTKNLDDMIYSSWNIESDRLKLVIMSHFLPFLGGGGGPKNKKQNKNKNQNFEYMKKVAGDIIILHMYTTNYNHMRYCTWDTECETEFFVILGHFLPFHPPNNLEKEMSSFYKCVPKITIIFICFLRHIACNRHNF